MIERKSTKSMNFLTGIGRIHLLPGRAIHPSPKDVPRQHRLA